MKTPPSRASGTCRVTAPLKAAGVPTRAGRTRACRSLPAAARLGPKKINWIFSKTVDHTPQLAVKFSPIRARVAWRARLLHFSLSQL